MVFVTSDMHLNHSRILTYEKRPFKDVKEMNEILINNWNSIVSPDDIVYDLGDFSFGKYSKYEKLLNGHIFHILGNHDDEKWPKSAILEFGGHEILLTHKKPMKSKYKIVLFGHIHSLTKETIEDGVFYYNVGTDVNNFHPVKLQKIITYYNSKISKLINK